MAGARYYLARYYRARYYSGRFLNGVAAAIAGYVIKFRRRRR